MKYIFTAIITICSFTKGYTQCNASFTTYLMNEHDIRFIPADSSANKIHTWYYGDGTYDTYTYGNKSYEQPGSYTVKHIIYDTATHCKDSVIQTITLSYTPQCYAIIYFQRGFPDMNTYYFQSGSYATGTSIVQYTWKINGQTVGNDNYLNYTFSSPVDYEVCLEIKTKSGCTSSYCKTFHTFSKCDLKPDFTYTPDESDSRLVYFQSQHNDSLMRYRWMLNASQEMYNPYWFSEPGKYKVTMYAIDSIHYCYDSTIKTINVNANCYDTLSVLFSYTPDPGLPNKITFTPESSEPLTNQSWHIYSAYTLLDSIAVVSGNSFTYTFSDTGYYRISATLYTQNGCSKEVTEYIRISSISNSPRQSIVSYPNPADGYVVLPFTATTNETIKVIIYNIMGKQVLWRQEALLKGSNQIRTPTTQLNKGQYFVSFIYNNRQQKSRFQKL